MIFFVIFKKNRKLLTSVKNTHSHYVDQRAAIEGYESNFQLTIHSGRNSARPKRSPKTTEPVVALTSRMTRKISQYGQL